MDYNFIINPPKEVYDVRIDDEEIVKQNEILSWEISFFTHNKRNKYVMQYHPSLYVMLDNLKVILTHLGYKNLEQFFRTHEELNKIDAKRVYLINRDIEPNFEYKTIIKQKKGDGL